MNDKLVDALVNRIEYGDDKESLRAEVLAAGHSEAIFEASFREATLQVAERQADADFQATQEAEARAHAAAVAAATAPVHEPVAAFPDRPTRQAPPEVSMAKPARAMDFPWEQYMFGLRVAGVIMVVAGLVWLLFSVLTSDRQPTSATPPEVVAEATAVKEESANDDPIATAIRSNITSVSKQADAYWDENFSYAGMCEDPEAAYDLLRRVFEMGAGDVHCADNRSWYLIEAELPSGDYYCIDSAGSNKINYTSRKGKETCTESVFDE